MAIAKYRSINAQNGLGTGIVAFCHSRWKRQKGMAVGDQKKFEAIANFKEAIKQYMENSPLRSGYMASPF